MRTWRVVESRPGRKKWVASSRAFFRPWRGLGLFWRDEPSDESLGYFRGSLRDDRWRRRAEMSHELPQGWTIARIAGMTECMPNIKPEDSPDKEFG